MNAAVYKERYMAIITPNGWKCSCSKHLDIGCLIIGDHFFSLLFGKKKKSTAPRYRVSLMIEVQNNGLLKFIVTVAA